MKEYFQTLKQKVYKLYQDAKLQQIYTKTRDVSLRTYNKSYNFLNRAGTYLGEMGISANAVSWLGFFIGIFAINFLAMEMYGWALIAILLNRFCDGLDGAIARSTKVTDFGVFLDASLDYIFYGGVIFGFAMGNPDANALPACFLLFAFAAAACAMLAYSVVAYKNNSRQELNLDQSPFYLGGIAQGAETLVALVVLCLVPQWFGWLAVLFGVFSLIKAFSIIVAAYYNFVILPYRKNS